MKNDIKDTLKEFGFTKVEFSKRIKITRQTLDNYISLINEGKDLPKDKYQKIFMALFNRDYDTQEEFVERLEQFENMLERDERFGMSHLDSKKTDLVMSIHRKSVEVVTDSSENIGVLQFLDYVLRNFEEDSALLGVIKYYNYLNRKVVYNEDSEQLIVSNYHKLRVKYLDGDLKVDKVYLDLFEKEIEEARLENERKLQEVRDRIKESLLNDADIDLDAKAINKLLNSLKL